MPPNGPPPPLPDWAQDTPRPTPPPPPRGKGKLQMEINHDWDNEDYRKTLESAWADYRRACYGANDLPWQQTREVKQAFLSGIAWLASRDDYCPNDVQIAVRAMIIEMLPDLKNILGIIKHSSTQ